MKKNLFYLFALVCSMSLFTACSDDDGPNLLPVTEVNTDYSGDQLAVTYSGEALTGKKVTFNSADGKTATLTLTGAPVSLGSLGQVVGESLNLVNPGIVPGETSTTLNVTLQPVGETGYSFEGTDETSERTLTYKGSVEKGKLALDVNVTLPTNDLLGTWNLYPYSAYGDFFPLRTKWETEQKFDLTMELFPGYEVPIQYNPGEMIALMSAVRIVPAGEETLNLQECISALLQSLTFNADGTVVATYSDAANMAAPVWQQTSANLVQYVIKNGKLNAYLNVDAIVQLVMGGAMNKAINTSDILSKLLPGLLDIVPMLSSGIPLGYDINEAGVLGIYIDQEFGTKLINALMPLLEDPEIVQFIQDAATSSPEFASFSSMVGDMLTQFPEVAATTTMMQLGLNLVKDDAEAE